MAMLEIPDELAGLTYMVRHNPNCPKPFEVRLTGAGLLREFQNSAIGAFPMQSLPDDVGYGMTLFEAAKVALDAQAWRRGQPNRDASARLFRELWAGL
jgi:hypothetical protein